MFEKQILILAAQQEDHTSLDENGMEPLEDILAEVFWNLLATKNDEEE